MPHASHVGRFVWVDPGRSRKGSFCSGMGLLFGLGLLGEAPQFSQWPAEAPHQRFLGGGFFLSRPFPPQQDGAVRPQPRQQRPAHQLAPEAKFVTESQRSGQQDDQGQRFHSQTSSSTSTSPSSTSPLVATTPSWMQLQHHTEPSLARQTSPLAATTPQWMQQQHLSRPFPPQQALHTRTSTITSTTYNTPLSLVKTPPLSPRASTTACAGRGCCGPGP